MKEAGSIYPHKDVFHDLEACCQLVAFKYSEKQVTAWSNLDFIKLSGIIYRHTNVQISASTLKRVFGKFRTTERYYPQQATRDALAQFAGFKDWEAFVQQNPTPVHTDLMPAALTPVPATTPPSPNIETISYEMRKPQRIVWPIVAAALVVVLIAGAFFFASYKKSGKATNLSGITLACSNPEGRAPHSALFHLKVPTGFTGDSSRFEIDFGDGKVKASVPGRAMAHYYELPGRYYAFLKYDHKVVDSAIVYLQSNGWEAIAQMERDTIRVYPVPFDAAGQSGNLMVSSPQLLHAGIDTSHTFYVHFSRIQPFAISGDNFDLALRLNTSAARPGVRCSQVTVQVYGERSRHSVMFLNTGCVSWGRLTFSELQLDGQSDDLGFIGANLSQGGLIKLHVQDQHAVLSLNDKPVYSCQYLQPLNKIYGLRISFAGIGAVDSIGLRDLGSGVTRSERF